MSQMVQLRGFSFTELPKRGLVGVDLIFINHTCDE